MALLRGRTERGYATELFAASAVLAEPVGSVVLRHHLVRVTACAPDGSSSTVTKLVQPAAQIPPRPGPISRDVHARRSGHDVVVTWSIARPLPRISFVVIGTRKPADDIDQPYVRTVRGRQRTRFRVVLRPEDARAIVRVTVSGSTNEAPYRGGAQSVRVR